ncbi:hypothetical protein MSUIS_04630 [Mycoplasma suis KI3806]|uniref:Uncharacterized protein n=1 Tax=Mycoplasma suis (strain KI_3806) TaxID=708248 RepID=F0V1M5_MYCS3|nr:hypothetical protein [Mycoplasma suis]CBZ40556.1 hypothetical protein MSUIS_04630 [Mycoplasma suis KI3806]
MKFFSLPFLKGTSFLALFSLPIFGISFYSNSKETDPFKLGKASGLTTRVRLYIDGLPEQNQIVSATSVLGGGISDPSNNYQIMKVDNQQVSSPQPQPKNQRTPALIAELSLKNLNRLDWQKFCLPEGSILKKINNNAAAAAAASSTQSTQNQISLCTPEWLSYSKDRTRENSELIDYLMKTLTLFIQVDHVANMFAIYDEKTHYPNNNGRSNNGQITEKLKSECKLDKTSTKEVLTDLFFTTSWKRKHCLLSPVTMKVNIDLKGRTKNQEPQSPNSLTKEIISKGLVTGNINYGLFDYWGGLRKIPKNGNNNDQKKIPIFRFFNKERKYALTTGTCTLESIYKLVDYRNLTKDKFFEKCPPQDEK